MNKLNEISKIFYGIIWIVTSILTIIILWRYEPFNQFETLVIALLIMIGLTVTFSSNYFTE